MNSSRLIVYFSIILILIVSFLLRLSWQEKPITLPKNQSVVLEAVVKTEPKISKDRQVIEIGDGKAYVALFPRYWAGDRLKIEGKVDELGRIYNPKVEKIGQVSSIWYWVSSVRTKISEKIFRMLPNREATLVVGSVLGVDNIDAKFRDELISTGTIHVVVVSGQNLAIVAGVFMGMSKFLGRRRSLVLATIFVFLYAALTGFSTPVVRASVMVLISTIAVYFGRELLPIWGLFVSALLILFIWPLSIFEISFQLTFAATLGIMTLGKWLMRGPVTGFLPASARSQLSSMPDQKSNGSLRAVGSPPSGATPTHGLKSIFFENAAVATSAYLFTGPVIFWHFGRVSLVAPLANVLIAEAVFPIMVFGFLTAFASLIFMPLAQLFAYFAYVPAWYFVKVVEFFANFKF